MGTLELKGPLAPRATARLNKDHPSGEMDILRTFPVTELIQFPHVTCVNIYLLDTST